jgi:hypothetical protein
MMIVWHQSSCFERRIHRYSVSQTDQMEQSMNCLFVPEKDRSRCCQHWMGLPVELELGQSRSFQHLPMMIVWHQCFCSLMGIRKNLEDLIDQRELSKNCLRMPVKGLSKSCQPVGS